MASLFLYNSDCLCTISHNFPSVMRLYLRSLRVSRLCLYPSIASSKSSALQNSSRLMQNKKPPCPKTRWLMLNQIFFVFILFKSSPVILALAVRLSTGWQVTILTIFTWLPNPYIATTETISIIFNY